MSAENYIRPDTSVEEWWNEPLTEELIEHIVASPKLIEFADYVLDLEPEVPDLVPGKLRPLTATDDHAGDQLIRNQVRGSERIRALALYAHEVAVWDPLPLELLLFRRASPGERLPQRVHAALRSVLEAKPLADAEIVVWVPSFAQTVSETVSTLSPDIDLALDVLDVDRLPLVDSPPLPVGVTTRNPHYSPWDDVHFAIADMAADLWFCHEGVQVQPLAGNDLAVKILELLVDPSDWRLTPARRLVSGRPRRWGRRSRFYPRTAPLEQLTRRLGKRGRSDPRIARLEQLTGLVDHLALPSVSDIVAVRQSSTAFAGWRVALETALDAVECLGDEPSDITTARQIVNEELAGPRQRILDELDRSSALSSLRRAASGLGWSVLGASGPVLAGGNLEMAGIAVGAGTAINWTRGYLADLGRRRKDRSLLAHYLTFGSVSSGQPKETMSPPEWTYNRPVYRSPTQLGRLW